MSGLPKPRALRRDEVEELFGMLCDLAEFEKITHLVKSSPADFTTAIFEEKRLRALVVDGPDSEGPLAGFAIFYENFSSFTGKAGLWLEDLFIRPQFRGMGYGSLLLDRFLAIGKEEGYGRAEWSVLDWNEPAIEFYQGRETDVMPDWRICRVTF